MHCITGTIEHNQGRSLRGGGALAPPKAQGGGHWGSTASRNQLNALTLQLYLTHKTY